MDTEILLVLRLKDHTGLPRLRLCDAYKRLLSILSLTGFTTKSFLGRASRILAGVDTMCNPLLFTALHLEVANLG